MSITLTKAMALKEGYEYFGYSDRDGFQSCNYLEDFDEEQYKPEQTFLFSKEETHPSISSESIKEMVEDQLPCTWQDESGDDTDECYDCIKAMDVTLFDDIAEKINKAVSGVTCRMMTDIALIP